MKTQNDTVRATSQQSRTKGNRTIIGDYVLDEDGIKHILTDVDEVLAKNKRSEKDRECLLGSLQSMLENAIEHGLRGSETTLALEKSLLSQALVLERPADPNTSEQEDELPFIGPPVKNLELEGLVWTFERKGSMATARLALPHKKLGSGQAYLIAIGAAVATVLLLSAISNDVLQTFVDRFASPLFEAGIGLFVALMGVMVFLSLVSCISGLNELSTLRTMGKTIACRVIGADVFALFVAAAGGLLLLKGYISVDGGSADMSVDILSMLIGIIPSSLFQPFIDGNVLQIAFWAIVFGVGLIVLKPLHPEVVNVVNGLNALIQWAINQLARIMPLIIYFAIVRLSVSLSPESLSMLVQYLLTLAIVIAVIDVTLIALISRRTSLSFSKVLRMLSPLVILGFLTASSNACYSTLIDTMKKFGVKDSLANFHAPLAIVLSHPGSISCFVCVLCACMPLEGMTIGIHHFVTILLLCFVMGISTPSVAGGSVAMFAILFSAVGLSDMYLPLFLAVDMLADMMLTTANLLADVSTCVAVKSDLENE